jgi:O-antigen ligase
LTARLRAADLLPLVAAAAVPFIFLNERYQVLAVVGPATVYGSDVAIACVVVAAFYAGWKFGWEPLGRTRLLWVAAAALLALFAVSCFWQPLERTTKHLVTEAKVVEYALLAPSVVLLLRRSIDLDRFFRIYVAWSAAAAGWGVLQFFGLVNEYQGKRPGQREVSFIGHQDLGAFTGATLTLAFAAIALGERRRLVPVAVVAGGLGVIIDASVFAYAGTFLAALAAIWIGRRLGTITARRVAAVAAILLVVGSGVYVLRGSDVSSYLGFLGVTKANIAVNDNDVQSGSQRATLLYIGWRIFEAHPVLGVGFDRSDNRYQPFLAAAKRKFPNQPRIAYPSKGHEWGVQNFWVQLLADTGIVGFALAALTYGTALVKALQAAARRVFPGLVAAGFIVVAIGTSNAIGIVAGIPLDAVTWLGFGLAIVATSLASAERPAA